MLSKNKDYLGTNNSNNSQCGNQNGCLVMNEWAACIMWTRWTEDDSEQVSSMYSMDTLDEADFRQTGFTYRVHILDGADFWQAGSTYGVHMPVRADFRQTGSASGVDMLGRLNPSPGGPNWIVQVSFSYPCEYII